ncbi:hypothetical protein V8J36_22650 [Frigidibacter sp. MR17.14]|uniref:hypothetical protein n=1 Tax=Frigidibacter sp. MR17.14 TaxID=3126509 RepID=UPI003012EF85
MKPYLGVAACSLLLLAACAPKPIVTDYNGDSVKIQANTLVADKKVAAAAIKAEADRICKTGGRTRSEYASTRNVADFTDEHLYLCLN